MIQHRPAEGKGGGSGTSSVAVHFRVDDTQRRRFDSSGGTLMARPRQLPSRRHIMPTIESRARLFVATLTLGMTGAASMASSVAAQDRGKAGTIAGVVRDSAGASVAGADVRIGGTALRTESNADG